MVNQSSATNATKPKCYSQFSGYLMDKRNCQLCIHRISCTEETEDTEKDLIEESDSWRFRDGLGRSVFHR